MTIGAFLYFQQEKLLFPAPAVSANLTPKDLGLEFEDLQISVNARDHLHAWWIPAVPASGKVILGFHGNGYVLEDAIGEEVTKLHDLGTSLLLVDYRGYGSSTRIIPNETTIDEDAQATLKYALGPRRVPIGDVFVLGRSIGTGAASFLAATNQGLGGLVLESPFTSIDDAAAGFWYFRVFPLHLMLRTHFDNLSKITSVRAPVLIVSGTADKLTPIWMAEKIFAQAHSPKQLYRVPDAGHYDLLAVGGDALSEVISEFIRQQR